MYQTNEKSFSTKLKDKIKYFSDKSSLRWVGYVISISDIPLFKRIFWFFTLSACVYGFVSVLRVTLGFYADDAVSYSVETDYLDWNTPFPAVTLCDQADNNRIKSSLVAINIPPSLTMFSKDISFWNKDYCKSCFTCEMNQTCVHDFLPLVEIVRFKCEELLTDCWWDDEQFRCCDRFKPIATEYGVCFVFNSQLTGDGTISYINRKVGLPSLVFFAVNIVSIRLHSPDDMVTVASENILGHYNVLHLVSDFEVILKAEQTVSDISVQSIPPSNRDCLFSNERPVFAHQWPFGKYSYSACVWYCRVTVQLEYCNCTHHFMPRIGISPVCDIEGLKCLNKNKEMLAAHSCDCPMQCEEVVYKVAHVSCIRHSGKLPEELISRGTRGHIRLGQFPSLRVRRHAIRDMLGLVVDIGGVVGVFFGASLLSFIEIIYIFCIRRQP